MKSTNITYLHCRNGIFYYRNQSTWVSLKSRDKEQAFIKMCSFIAQTPVKPCRVIRKKLRIKALINDFISENKHRWCAREVTRITSALTFLPEALPNRKDAIELKKAILKVKTSATFNRYLKYFNAFFKWAMSNHHEILVNPFLGLKIIEKKADTSSLRNAYTSEQLKRLYQFASSFGKSDKRYWLILLARYTGARMNEICQLKPQDVTNEAIHIRGDTLKTSNAKRSIPTHPKLIELGLLEWADECLDKRLFHEWRVVKGSYSHAGSRWFSRNNPFKGDDNSVDFHSIRHTVATELKMAGVPAQFAAQILGHANGNITYDRYGKNFLSEELKLAVMHICKD
jgi:integrase